MRTTFVDALMFLAEVWMLLAWLLVGANLHGGVAGWLIGVGLALLAASLWGAWAAPRSRRRLRGAALLSFRLGVFLACAAAVGLTGDIVYAAVFAGVTTPIVLASGTR